MSKYLHFQLSGGTMKQTMRCFRLLLGLYVFSQALHSATYVLFLQKNGLDLFQVNLVNFCFFTTLFAFEIPTGAFADVFGRKPSFLVACALWAIGLAIYGWSTTIWGFIASELLLAIGATFFSGAFEAWYVDSIAFHGQEAELQRFLSHKEQLEQWVGIAAMMTGAMIAEINLAFPWFLGSFTMLLAFFAAIAFMREDYFTRNSASMRVGLAEIKRTAKVSVEYGLKNPAVRFLIFVGTFQFFAMQPSNMFWAPYFANFTSSFIVIGIVRVVMQLAIIAGALYSTHFASKFSDYRIAILSAQMLIAVSLAVSGLPWFAASLGLFLTHEVGRGIFAPIKSKFLHANIPSSERATISSFESLFNHLGGAVGLLLAGLVGNYWGIPASWFLFGLTLLLASFWQYRRQVGSGVVH